MAVFRVRSTFDETVDLIRKWLQKQATTFSIDSTDDPSGGTTEFNASAAVGSGRSEIDLSLTVSQENRNFVLVRLNSLAGRRSLLAILGLYVPCVAYEYFLAFLVRIKDNPDSSGLVVASVALLVPFLAASIAFVLYVRSLSSKQKKLQHTASDMLRREFEVETIAPIKSRLLPTSARVFFIATQSVVMILMLLLVGLDVFVYGMAIVGIVCMPMVYELGRAGRTRLEWKYTLANIGGWWSALCAFFLLALVLPIGFVMGQLKGGPSIGQLSFASISAMLNSPESAAGEVSAILSAGANLMSHVPLGRAFATVGIFVIVIVVPLGAYLFMLCILIWISKSWKELSGSAREPGSVTPPVFESEDDARESRTLSVQVSIHYTVSVAVNAVASLCAIDGMSYLFGGGSFLLGNLWQWIPAFFGLVVPSTIGYVCAAVYTFVLCLPLVLGALLNAKKLLTVLVGGIVSGIADTLLASRNKVPDERTAAYIRRLADSLGYRKVRTQLTDRRGISAEVRWNLMGNHPTVFLSRKILEDLSQQEVEALLAHEFGHRKEDLIRLEMLKILSAIAFFSNYYLVLSLDLSTIEFAADEFAVRQTGKPHALVSAIVKSGWQIARSSSGRVRLPSRVRWLLYTFDFLFGDGLLGYCHPPIGMRIENLNRRGLL